jgi:hypothetical protein
MLVKAGDKLKACEDASITVSKIEPTPVERCRTVHSVFRLGDQAEHDRRVVHVLDELPADRW